MYKSALVVLAAAALVLGSIIPASAQFQSTVDVHYWGTGLQFQNGSGPSPTDSGSAWGISYRGDALSSPWSVSVRYDSLSVTPSSWPWNSGSLWDVNGHYRFGPDLNKYFGVFVGYGSVNVASTSAPANTGGQSGARLGAEFLVRQPNGWFVSGDASYGPSWGGSFTGFPSVASGNVTDFRITGGREFANGASVELGWRSVNWNIPTSPGCLAPNGCTWTFSGVIFGVNFRR